MTGVEKKKRERKSKKVDFEEEYTLQESSFEIEEQLIIHLPIKHEDIISVDFSEKLKLEENKPVNNLIKNSNPTVENFIQSDRLTGTVIENDITTYTHIPIDSWDIYGNFKHNKTNICCWWCTFNFDTYPVFLPLRYVDKLEEEKSYFKVKGVFCSFECAAAYGLKYEKEFRSLYLLKFFYKKLHKSKGVTNISPAPPKEILDRYGGNIKIEDFRKGNHTMFSPVENKEESYFINNFPVKYIPTQIGRKRIKNMIEKSVQKIKHNNKLINFV